MPRRPSRLGRRGLRRSEEVRIRGATGAHAGGGASVEVEQYVQGLPISCGPPSPNKDEDNVVATGSEQVRTSWAEDPRRLGSSVPRGRVPEAV